ncbi:MAG: restriction endonuclease subunit S [Deltaproteobacteria bacterium]|nr:restriction endonuclease subunit S [Deltaproteobacteria bacterium]
MQRYSAYKDSGVDWIGAIPEGWKICNFRYLIKVLTDYTANGSFGDLAKNVNYIDYPSYSRLIRLTDLRKNLKDDGVYLNEKSHKYLKKSELFGEELLMANVGAYAGFACIMPKVDYRASLGPNMFLIKTDEKKIALNYLLHLLNSTLFWSHINTISKSAAQPKLNKDNIRELKIIIPTSIEQKAIANFLKENCNKIDQAIAQKEKMIGLLKERKQIMIQNAVTRGLNPAAKMKDSGVDWIGKIPEHWNTKRLRLIGNTQNGISAGAEYFGTGYPFVSYGDVYNNRELPTSVKGLANSSEEDRKQYSLEKGDVLFTRTSETVEEIGFASTCMKKIQDSTFSGFLIRFRPKTKDLCEGFSKHYFNASMLRFYFVKEMNLVTRASLSQELLKNLTVLLPPYEEQEKIYSFIEKESFKIKKAMALQQKQIEKIKEYKATLIDSAVTGKIKVS